MTNMNRYEPIHHTLPYSEQGSITDFFSSFGGQLDLDSYSHGNLRGTFMFCIHKYIYK